MSLTAAAALLERPAPARRPRGRPPRPILSLVGVERAPRDTVWRVFCVLCAAESWHRSPSAALRRCGRCGGSLLAEPDTQVLWALAQP